MTDTRTATPWDVDSLMSLDIRRHVTDDILAVINTPHDHESPDTNRPIWIIWSLRNYPLTPSNGCIDNV